MTTAAFAILATALEMLPPQYDQPWNDKAIRWYFQQLQTIPDCDTAVVAEIIGTQCKKRPTPAEILERWRDVVAPAKRSAADVVGEILTLRSKYGSHVVPDENFPRLLKPGEPQWTDDVKRRVVAVMGGWVAYCEDDTPIGVQRGQLMRAAEQILAGSRDESVNELRLEYQEAKRLRQDEARPLLTVEGVTDGE